MSRIITRNNKRFFLHITSPLLGKCYVLSSVNVVLNKSPAEHSTGEFFNSIAYLGFVEASARNCFTSCGVNSLASPGRRLPTSKKA